MHQQTQISLNFEEIFNNNQPYSNIEEILPQSPILSQSFTSPASKYQSGQKHNQTNRSQEERSGPNVPFFHRQKLVHSASQQITSIKKLMFNCFAIKLKKPTVADIEKITKRLTESKSCKKLKCAHTNQQKQQEKKPNSNKNKGNLSKSNSVEAFPKMYSIINPVNVFDRLHYNSKIKNLKRSHLKKQSQRHIQESSPQSKKSKISSTSEKYLKNYVPFYKRLQGQLNRTLQKAELIKKNPRIVSQLQNMTFQPKLYSSVYSRTVKSKYMGRQRGSQGKDYADNDLLHLMNSSVNTTSEAVNRSMQIIDRVQQHFFNKMRLIFVNEQTGQVKVSHQSVSLLSELEFSILSTFIMYIQQNQIRADDFDYYLRSYFYNLSIPQRMQLRSHQTQSRFKYTQLIQFHKTNCKIAEKNSKKNMKNSGSIKVGQSRSRISQNSYHLNIQHYT